MHAVFIAYGIKQEVDHFFMDLQAQKHLLKTTSPDGKTTKPVWIQGSLRLLPFGIVEYVFPKEDMDLVLTSLNFNKEYDKRYALGGIRAGILRKFLKVEKIPEFKTDRQYLWYKDNVEIIPIGIREDGDYAEPEGESKGWTHEAI